MMLTGNGDAFVKFAIKAKSTHHVPNRTLRISCLAILAQSIYFPDSAINRFQGPCVSGYITCKRKVGGGDMAWAGPTHRPPLTYFDLSGKAKDSMPAPSILS